MRRQRHPQIHPFTTYRQGEPSGQPLQTLDITTVHLKYMDVCRADAWTGIKFFQQKPDGKADKIIIAHAYDLSACQCAVCQAEQSPAECCLYGTLGLVQCYIRYGAFVECRTVFFTQRVSVCVPCLFAFRQSAIQAEVNPLESKSLFHILLSVMSKPYASAALFQYAQPDTFVLYGGHDRYRQE